ncbi:PAS domain S-box protein [Pseudomonas jessenii]|uniref:PAS domain S-box protein n=1 Tax=Pseudomonas jessenii TaxID=77298 RepID=UPI00389179B7
MRFLRAKIFIRPALSPFLIIWSLSFILLMLIIGLGCWTLWCDYQDRMRSVTIRTQLLTASIADYTSSVMLQRRLVIEVLAEHLLNSEWPLNDVVVTEELKRLGRVSPDVNALIVSVGEKQWTPPDAAFDGVDWRASRGGEGTWLGTGFRRNGKIWLPLLHRYGQKNGEWLTIGTLVPLVFPQRYFDNLGLTSEIALGLLAPEGDFYWQQGRLPSEAQGMGEKLVQWVREGVDADALLVRERVADYPLQIVVSRWPIEFLAVWYAERRLVIIALLCASLAIIGGCIGLTTAWRRIACSEQRYRRLFQAIPDAALLLGASGVQEANAQAADFFGVENSDELHAIPFLELCTPDQPNEAQALTLVTHLLLQAEKGIESSCVLKFRQLRQEHFFFCEVHFSQIRLSRKTCTLVCMHDVSARQLTLDELLLSEHKLLEAQLIAGLGVWSWEVGTERATWTDECARVFGLPSMMTQCSYTNFFDSIVPAQRRYAKYSFERALEGARLDIELQIQRPDGHLRNILICGELRSYSGRQLLVGALHDITAQKRVEHRLSQGGQGYRELVEMLPEGLLIVRNFIIVFANLTAAKLFGVESATQMCGMDIFDFVNPIFHQQIMEDHARILKPEYVPGFMSRHYRRAEGTDFEVEVSAQRLFIDEELCIRVMLRDVSEHRRLQHDLETANGRFQRLSSQIIEVQERERHHLARELHDDVGQLLTFIKITASGIQRHLDGEIEQRQGVLVRIAEEALSKVRDLSRMLRPAQLDGLGLAAAMNWQMDYYSPNSPDDVVCDLNCEDLQPRPESCVEITLFRIFQEALSNALKHARAKVITISLNRSSLAVCLKINDDGCGFDYDGALMLGKGMGLMNMAERAKFLGGDFILNSIPGQGTEIQVNIPDNSSMVLRNDV